MLVWFPTKLVAERNWGLRHSITIMISEMRYLPLQSRDMSEMTFK